MHRLSQDDSQQASKALAAGPAHWPCRLRQVDIANGDAHTLFEEERQYPVSKHGLQGPKLHTSTSLVLKPLSRLLVGAKAGKFFNPSLQLTRLGKRLSPGHANIFWSGPAAPAKD